MEDTLSVPLLSVNGPDNPVAQPSSLADAEAA
jgi:hypothetical protein